MSKFDVLNVIVAGAGAGMLTALVSIGGELRGIRLALEKGESERA